MKNLCALIIAILFAVPGALALDIVRDGQPCTAIVIPDEAFPMVQAAADELQYHIEKSSGARLKVCPESQKPAEFEGLIYIGDCHATRQAGLRGEGVQMATNAFGIKLIGENLFLYGDDGEGDPLFSGTRIGSISAVYELLEDKLGVRWLWPGPLGEYIPNHKTISVDEWDREYRQQFTSYHLEPRLKYNVDGAWSNAKHKEQFSVQTKMWLRRQRVNRAECVDAAEPFHNWWKRFGKTHPEYFALLPDGRRGPLEGDRTGWQTSMCLSNPEMHKQLIEDWKNPKPFWTVVHGLSAIRVSENDTPSLCTCERCRAWDAADPRFETSDYWGKGIIPTNSGRFRDPDLFSHKDGPSLSDRFAKYYLAIQKEAQKVNPDVIVSGFAYANYSDPPKETMLNDRIQIVLVPPSRYPLTEDDITEFREQWDGWRKTGARLVLRPNFVKPGHNMPVAQTRALYKIITYAAANGMVGGQYDCMQGEWGTQGTSMYLLGRVHVRPELPLETILDEFYSAFGPARDAVKDYFNHWEDLTESLTQEQFDKMENIARLEGFNNYKNWLPIAPYIFTPEVMAKGRVLLEKVKATPGLSEQEAARVAFLDDGLRHAEQTLVVTIAAKRFNKIGSTRDRDILHAELRKLRELRRSIDSNPVSNMDVLHNREGLWSWPPEAKAMSEHKNATPLAEIWKFRFDPEQIGLDSDWHLENLDDSAWTDIRVDAPWERQKPGMDWRAEHDGADYDGIGWYRTTFEAPHNSQEQKRIVLLFGAVDESCDVFVNGEKVHSRRYDRAKNPDSWREPFKVDVTNFVNEGENLLSVRVEDRAGAGGIWRPVHLVIEASK